MSAAILILLVCGVLAWGDLSINIHVNPTQGFPANDAPSYKSDYERPSVSIPKPSSPFEAQPVQYYFLNDPVSRVTLQPLAALTL